MGVKVEKGAIGEVSQLTAGAQHVPPTALSHEGIQTGVVQDGLELKDALFGWAKKTTAWKLVERNQIDLAS
ncbi:MAG: hypothetical protein OEV51_04280, partial [Nitrospira sp.]|nr:hypothetical protein [Nitrospira sp.]